jgi:hypothetical protein
MDGPFLGRAPKTWLAFRLLQGLGWFEKGKTRFIGRLEDLYWRTVLPPLIRPESFLKKEPQSLFAEWRFTVPHNLRKHCLLQVKCKSLS